MSKDRALERLVTSRTESTDVRSLLEAGIADDIGDYDYERGLSLHLALVVAPPVGTGAAPNGAGSGVSGVVSGSSKALALAIGVPIASLSVAAALVFLRGHSAPDAPDLAARSRGAVVTQQSAAPTSNVDPARAGAEPAEGFARGSSSGLRAGPSASSGEQSGSSSSSTRESESLLGRESSARLTPSPSPSGSARRTTGVHPEISAQAELAPPGENDGASKGAGAIVREFPNAPGTGVVVEAPHAAVPAAVSSAEAGRSDEALERDRQAREEARQKSDDRLQRDMEDLMRAKRALTDDPKLALELARHGEREFKGSLLSEERQHVLLLALIQLGRVTEAERLATPYLAKHPDSPFARRVRTALEAAAKRAAH